MSELIQIDFPDGQFIFIEAEDDITGSRPVGIQKALKISSEEFIKLHANLADLVQKMSVGIREKLKDSDSITIEFGAKLSADIGFVIAKSQAEVNFKISASWKKL